MDDVSDEAWPNDTLSVAVHNIRSVDERLGQLTRISHMTQALNHGFGASTRLGYRSIPDDGYPYSCIIL
jgi:hypothetical protein